MTEDAAADGVDDADALDVAVLGAVAVVASVATGSLVTAHLRMHSMFTVGLFSLALVGLGVWAMRRWSPVRIKRPSASAALIVPGVVMAAILMFPGFRYATGDKDPGIYVLHATSISATGELAIPKTDLQQARTFTVDDVYGAQWRGFGFNVSDTEVIPSFYHLWPALLATAFDAVGFGALAVVVPLLGLLCVALAFCVGRRLAGPLAGGGAALLLATNMMEVWQAKYPTAEILGQTLFLGAALAIALALQTSRPGYAAFGGTLVACGFLNRGEGVALVLLVAAVVALAYALNVRSRLAVACAVGMALPMPLALWQAYSVAGGYSQANHVPSFRLVASLLVVAALFALVARRLGLAAALRGLVPDVSAVASRRLRWCCTVLALGLFLVGTLRPLFGDDYFLYQGVSIRSYDERSLHRLAWFFSWPGLVLALVGLLWAVWSRWSAARAVVIGSSLVFLLLFLFHASNSPYLMWWGRRFIPVAVPGVVLLAALSLGLAAVGVGSLHHAPRVRAVVARRRAVAVVVGVATVVLVSGYQTSQSAALRGHDEKAGSYGVARLVADAADGEAGVFLWERGPCCAAAYLLFGSPTWIIGGVDSAVLPTDGSAADYVRAVGAAAGGRPLFVVLAADSAPPESPGMVFTEVRRITGSLPVWEEQSDRRPDRAIAYDFDIVVYRVTID